jgi:hypothetical protein
MPPENGHQCPKNESLNIMNTNTSKADKKHNAGPWRWAAGSNTIRTQKGNYWIATVDSWDGCTNNEENAALIAAAPEMLEALQAIQAAYGRTDNGQPVAMAHAVKKTINAIRKANTKF